ncbi:twin-arginine translocase TatA/TatE family subunit [Legionella sp.]|uniref:twin-arginine translocase TatA/TatE family subunit n=1 Tax=Legionella sp. TaxID=459 RepID=UPI003C9EED62
MGLSGISPLSLLLILIIIIALFGTSKLKTIGTDLGEAIKNFRKALNNEQINTSSKNDKNHL